MTVTLDAALQALDRRYGVAAGPWGTYADDGPRDAVGLFLPLTEDAEGCYRHPVLALREDLDHEVALDVIAQLENALDIGTRNGRPTSPTAFGRPGVWLIPTRTRLRRRRRYW